MNTVAGKSPFYIESLDGIRSIAFLIVYAAHCGAKNIIPGGFGVTIFFFLSGYLITTLLRMELEKSGKINFGNFFVRRALRILPSQFIILSVAVALSLVSVLPVRISFWDTALQFLNLTNYLQIFGHEQMPYGTGVYWSLAVEEHFYLLFPFVFYLLASRCSYERSAIIFFAVCILILLWRIALVNIYDDFETRIYRGTDTRLDSILYGCILGIFLNPQSDRIPFRPVVWKYAILPTSFMLLLAAFMFRSPEMKETIRYTLQGLALFPVFICAVKFPGWYIFRPLNWGFVKHFGRLTYVLYLVHIIVLYLVEKYIVANVLPKALVAFVICIVVAEVFYYCIEKPFTTLRHRFSGTKVRRKKPNFTLTLLH